MAHGGGYDYDFIDKIPDNLLCQRCKRVARDPNVTSCCGEYFCKECISPFHRDNQPCPGCGEADFSMIFNRREQRYILSLKLYCPMKNRGCEWMGQLEQLEGHIEVQSGDCLYVDIECPSHCDQRVQKRNVQNHLKKECPLREFTCKYCNFKASFKVVTKEHYDVCSYLPVQCPNRCGVTCEREDLEDHMKICDKEELECCFNHVGCQGRFLREDEERHMEGVKKHLSLMADKMLKVSMEIEEERKKKSEELEKIQKNFQEQEAKFQELLQNLEVLQERKQEANFQEVLLEQEGTFQEALQKQTAKFQEVLREQEAKFQEMLQEQEVKYLQLEKKFLQQEVTFRKELQEKEDALEKIRGVLDKKATRMIEIETKFQNLEKTFEEHKHGHGAANLKDISNQVAELQYNTGHAYWIPITFTMPNFKELKSGEKSWYSPVVHTHYGGYSFLVVVRPSGQFRGEFSKSHVAVYYKAKPGDHDEQLKWPVTLSVTIELLNQHADRNHIRKITDFTYNRKTTFQAPAVGPFDYKFASHEELGWNPERETQYLKNNCLRFKVVKCEVKK